MALVALCLVGGFPGFTALAMKSVPAAHGGVVLGILPLATSALGTLIAGERPSAAFWLAALAGAGLVIGFTLYEGGGAGAGGSVSSCCRLVLGSRLCAVEQARAPGHGRVGGDLLGARGCPAGHRTPGPLAMPDEPASIPTWSWIGFIYVALMSQYLGFFAWNAGLALGGIAHVSQVQLLQTFVTLLIAAVLNREPIALSAWLVAAAVFLLVDRCQEGQGSSIQSLKPRLPLSPKYI